MLNPTMKYVLSVAVSKALYLYFHDTFGRMFSHRQVALFYLTKDFTKRHYTSGINCFEIHSDILTIINK